MRICIIMGIDLHKKYLFSTIMDKEGKVLKRTRLSTDTEYIKHSSGFLRTQGL